VLRLTRPNHKLRADDIDAVVAAYQAGASIKELGRQYELHEQTVRAQLLRRGVALRPWRALTDEQAVNIVASYQAGASLRELARQHGVAANSIRNCLVRAEVALRPARRPPRQAASS
jgi:lambda repressor-like predicted transcriptional regulator